MRPLHKLVVMGMLLFAAALASAQTLEIPQETRSYSWISKVHQGVKRAKSAAIALQATLAESHRIEVGDAPWLRLSFPNANLGKKSYLTITSVYDGATQTLNSTTLKEWYNTSAYFNGNAVEVKLFIAPNDENVFLEAGEITVGKWVGNDRALSKGGPGGGPVIESQCGPNDDRVPSNHPASGRIVSIGCTGWIVSNGKHVTAGHCAGSGTLQFDVPPSLPSGTIQNPPPSEQYTINTGTLQFVNGGVGNDWCVFEVNNNSQTGLQPIAAQGASFTVVQNLGPSTIRITGFGVDNNDPTLNQTQQTHAGPNVGSSGTTMRYQTDTEGGNSGSPVIDDANGNSVGVHTHGGCSTGGGGNNSGTSTFSAAFWNALQGAGGGCTNIALNRPATASSSSGSNTPNRAVDGSTGTFWRSGNGAPQWIQVDVGAGNTYGEATFKWRGERYARSYEVRVSNSSTGTPFTSVFSTTTGNGGSDIISFANRTEQFVRLHVTQWNNQHGRLNEFEVCGASVAAPKADSDAPEVTSAQIPEEFELAQNYPNPFNPSTTISFGLPEESHVTLKVHNLLGEEVATLVEGLRPAGKYNVTFAPEGLPSGVYFYTLRAGEARFTRRLVLMK